PCHTVAGLSSPEAKDASTDRRTPIWGRPENKKKKRQYGTKVLSCHALTLAQCTGLLNVGKEKASPTGLASHERGNSWCPCCAFTCISRTTHERKQHAHCSKIPMIKLLILSRDKQKQTREQPKATEAESTAPTGRPRENQTSPSTQQYLPLNFRRKTSTQ
ncbi:unnamed protein product, partial [Ectocarpus sp. 4 AP-2014]